jgi:D-glycero-D-manno-heptose 1,7-bisphosphate phosphatase
VRDRRGHHVPEVELTVQLLPGRAVQTVFLDRDGTLNRKAPEGAYVDRPAGLVLLPGAGPAVARLNRAGLRTVLVTNQRWLSRAGASSADYRATHARMITLLAREGARLDAAYHCPHERDTCDCRKPAPGLLRRAARELGFDLDTSVIIGDAVSDLDAGRAAGAGTILIATAGTTHPRADLVAPDLAAAVDLLLSRGPS